MQCIPAAGPSSATPLPGKLRAPCRPTAQRMALGACNCGLADLGLDDACTQCKHAATTPPPPSHRAFPSGRAVWRQLTQAIQLQEACFQDVVLLYRPAGEAARAAAAGGRRIGRMGGGKGGSSAGPRGGQQEELPSVEESVGGASDEVGSSSSPAAERERAMLNCVHTHGPASAL